MWHSFHPVYSSPKIYPVAARFNSTHTCSVSHKLSLSHICSAYTTLTYNRCVCINNDAHTSCSRPYWQKFYFMINFFEDQPMLVLDTRIYMPTLRDMTPVIK